MEGKNFNEVLKQREKENNKRGLNNTKTIKLDDTERVKVLSPGRMVFKRFVRNKLAIVGTAILLFMFTFSFIAPIFYAYGQTQIFYKYDYLVINYASASTRESYTNYQVDDDIELHYSVANMLTSHITSMESMGNTEMTITDDSTGEVYNLVKLGDMVYSLTGVTNQEVATLTGTVEVASYNTRTKQILYTSKDYTAPNGFEDECLEAIASGESTFTLGGTTYEIDTSARNLYTVNDYSGAVLTYSDGSVAEQELLNTVLTKLDGKEFTHDGQRHHVVANSNGTSTLYKMGAAQPIMVSTMLIFDSYETGVSYDDEFKAAALLAMYADGKFEHEGVSYTIKVENNDYVISSAEGEIAALDKLAIRRYSGEDTLSYDFKQQVRTVIDAMNAEEVREGSFTYPLAAIDEQGQIILDENGNQLVEDRELTITKKEGQYVINCEQRTYLIDIYAPPSSEHIFGTDDNGMDILARMMYGGQISLLVGFVVVIIEVLIGVILGGLAGFFSGWVDTLIMRLVDIFNCIPSMPILIILGAMFDEQKLSPYTRLMWMMAVLGFLGWAGVARLVRGQILSLREQEFMTAAEATGLSTSRRIFRHLVPNVMPQLIVTATMGLGSVIITESTLSFLGLGVKHPMATWGTMINSITKSNENLVRYSYIWIPVGMLICLTVIAFNFVGDGLRDAFDPKMK